MKASNILLDSDMNPKISDFGLTKLFDLDEIERNTDQIVGTYGYMPPEYVCHGVLSTKSDVYSYGVLVLEIVTGRKNYGFQASEHAPDLLNYVWQHWNGGTALELKDQRLDGDHFSAEGMLKCLHIGLLCVHEDPTQRPSMTSIVSMLNSYSTSLPAPSPPAYSFASYMMNGAQPRMDEASPVKTGINSVNNASITEIQPR